MSRTYTLKRRAERQQETRRRIIEAAMALHEEEGPARATISAIAERAGVERPTVYRHFPDAATLFEACTSAFNHQHPLPDADSLREIRDPRDRLRQGLARMYAYWRDTEQLYSRTFRDLEDLSPDVLAVLAPYPERWRAVQLNLMEGWDAPNPRLLEAAIGHAIAFPTWRSLIREQGLSDEEGVTVMADMVEATARRPG